MKDKSHLLLIAAAIATLAFTVAVTINLGIWGLVGTAFIAAFAAFLGRSYSPKVETLSDDLLHMKIQSLEMQLADEREMVAALTNELDPSDF